MCLNPKVIYKRGKYKENNYRGNRGEEYSIKAFTECGHCSQCLAKKANNWVVRNFYESKSYEKKCFITLTYAKTPIFLVRKDFQDWLKRFRFEINKEYYNNLRLFKKTIKRGDELREEKIKTWKIEHEKDFIKTKVFYAGEYGTVRGRAHFHAVIYGWEDKNAYFTGINKKINIVYESEIIRKTWGLGRTSYQDFGEHEISYISLYTTAQEEFKKSYKLTLDKTKKIREYIKKMFDYYPKNQAKNLLKELNEHEEKLIKEKKKYLQIKEFNGWSLSMGWESFFDNYAKQEEYAFTEYIFDMQFSTPAPWLKKLANKYGDIPAINELIKREQDIIKSKNETEEKGKAEARERDKRKKEIIEWAKNNRKNGEIDEF